MSFIGKKPFLYLFSLVFFIYMMRQNDLTLSRGLRHSLRVLSSGDSICNGVSLTESFSSADISRARSFMNNLRSQRGGNPLEDLVLKGNKIEGDDAKDYGMGLLVYIVPWAAFFALSGWLCFIFYINWCCMFGICKNMKCCKCCKLPKNPKKIKLCMGISSVFLVGMLGAAIAGTIFSSKVSTGMKVTYCSTLALFQDLVNGKMEDKWMGMDQIMTSVNDIESKLNSINLGQIGDTSTLTTPYQTTSNDITSLYNDKQGSTLDTPNNINSPATYSPDYITNLQAETDAMQTELDNWNNAILNAKSNINSAATDINNNKNSIINALDSAKNQAQTIVDSVDSVLDTLEDSGKTINDIFTGAGYGIMGIFVANLVLALFATISMIMMGVLKVKFFNKLLHLSWCTVILVTIFCFLLATVFLPSSVVLLEVCGVIDLALNDSTFFDKTLAQVFDSSDTNAKSIAQTCMYGNGDALGDLGIASDIDYFQTIYDQIDNVNQNIPIDADYSVTPPQSVTIKWNQDMVGLYASGYVPDAQTTIDQLKDLNEHTNGNTYSCASVQDTWFLNSINCTASYGYKLTSSDAKDYNLPSATCIGFDVWGTSSGSARYYGTTTFPAGTCTNPNLLYMQNYVTGFATHQDNVKKFFSTDSNSIQSYLTTIYNDQQNFASKVVDFINDIKNVRSQLTSIQDSLIGTDHGLIPNTKCTFIKNDLNNLSDSMCVGFVATMYITSIIMIITSFMAFLSTIMIFCLAKKFSVPESGRNNDKKVVPADYTGKY